MFTGLNISADDKPFNTVFKPIHRLITKNVGGLKGYIIKHARIGIVDNREHTTFLNMLLENLSSADQPVGPPPICNGWQKDSSSAVQYPWYNIF